MSPPCRRTTGLVAPSAERCGAVDQDLSPGNRRCPGRKQEASQLSHLFGPVTPTPLREVTGARTRVAR
jgi:hypothetical protein